MYGRQFGLGRGAMPPLSQDAIGWGTTRPHPGGSTWTYNHDCTCTVSASCPNQPDADTCLDLGELEKKAGSRLQLRTEGSGLEGPRWCHLAASGTHHCDGRKIQGWSSQAQSPAQISPHPDRSRMHCSLCSLTKILQEPWNAGDDSCSHMARPEA